MSTYPTDKTMRCQGCDEVVEDPVGPCECGEGEWSSELDLLIASAERDEEG